MSRRDRLVVHGFGGVAEMAGQALLIAFDQIARVIHAERDGLLIIPVPRRMGAQPVGGGPVTVFAADSVADIEGPRLLIIRDIEGMTTQAFCGRCRLDIQVAADPFSGLACESGEGLTGMFILDRPSAVFVL